MRSVTHNLSEPARTTSINFLTLLIAMHTVDQRKCPYLSVVGLLCRGRLQCNSSFAPLFHSVLRRSGLSLCHVDFQSDAPDHARAAAPRLRSPRTGSYVHDNLAERCRTPSCSARTTRLVPYRRAATRARVPVLTFVGVRVRVCSARFCISRVVGSR